MTTMVESFVWKNFEFRGAFDKGTLWFRPEGWPPLVLLLWREDGRRWSIRKPQQPSSWPGIPRTLDLKVHGIPAEDLATGVGLKALRVALDRVHQPIAEMGRTGNVVLFPTRPN